MTEEEQAALEAEQAEAAAKAEAEAQDAEFEASLEGLSDEEKEQKRAEKQKASNIENKIDYEAELKRERERREVAEKVLAEKRFLASKKKRETEEEQEEEQDDEDKPLTKVELRELLAEERQATQKVLHESRIKEIAKGLANSDIEAELIVEIHKGRMFPSHLSLEEQLEESHAIANRKRLQSENRELKRALQGKETVTIDAATAHHDAPKGKEPTVPPDMKIALVEGGFVYNPSSRQYEKKLAGGKVLILDWKTRQTWMKGTARPLPIHQLEQ